jgi:hypothetical protein
MNHKSGNSGPQLKKDLLRANPKKIVATIDGEEYVITESSIRTQMQLDDEGGVFDTNREQIHEGLANLGYQTDGKFIWYKNKFCAKWRFLIHTLLQCISPKSGGWDQFSSSLACGIICLYHGRVYNFSRYIFEEMLKNIKDTKYKFLVYHRFLQMILGNETNDHTPRPIGKLTAKLFATMRTNFDGVHKPLLPAMLPIGNEDAGAADAAGDNIPPTPDAAGANAPVTVDVGTSNVVDASASVAADAQPPPSRPSTPPSPRIVASDEQPIALDEQPHGFVESFNSPDA